MNHSQLAHRWAQQDPKHPDGRGSRMFYNGTRIYSHGLHWTIAQFVQNARGQRAVIVNVSSRSMSTGQHTRHVLRAVESIAGLPVLRVERADLALAPGTTEARRFHLANAKALLSDAADLALKAKRSRSSSAKQWREAEAVKFYERARAYARFFGVLSELPKIDLDALCAKREALGKAEAARAKADAEARREQHAQHFANWMNGAAGYCPASYVVDKHGSAYLRLSGDMVQTSKGAEVPRDHAERAVRFVLAVRASGQPWAKNGETCRVGPFQLDSVTPSGDVVAGCHRFTFQRVAELARALGIGVTS